MKYVPRPGDYGVVRSHGIFARLIQIGTLSRWNHNVIYIGDNVIVEANPKGVEIKVCHYDYTELAWNKHERLTHKQRERIVEHALSTVGSDYNFWTIALLAFRILGLKILTNIPLWEKLATTKGFICSELVSECYRVAGHPVSKKDDYLVTPGDLAERLIYQ